MDGLIPCLGVLGILTIVFGFIAFMRYLSYREALALAEKGLNRPEAKDRAGPGPDPGTLPDRLLHRSQLPAPPWTVDAGRPRSAVSGSRFDPAPLFDRKGLIM